MSLPRYPEYKDSGVELLGEVPSHWQVEALRRRAALNPSKSEIEEATHDGLASFLPMEAVGEQGELDLSRTRPIAEVSAGYTYFREGDVAFAKITPCFENGKGARMVGLHAGIGFGTTELTVVRPRPGLLLDRYLDWVLRSTSFRQRGEAAMYGAGGQKRVPDEFVREFSFAWPGIEEQDVIARFLDRETAKIDALIAEQEKLLALLAEKRQATISHAVTRGLDPNVPMKDSGIPWLGEVPAHWDVSPLKYISRIGSGSTPNRDNPDYWSDSGFPWLNSSVVNQDEVTEAERFVTALALKECHLPVIRPPAVLIGITGQGKTRGMAAPLMFEATINQHLAYVTPKPGQLEVAYLLRALEIAYSTLRTDSESAGSTKGAITCDQLSRFTIPLPPLDEQGAIAKHIDIKAAHFEKLASDSGQTIALLKERRSALIAAAVTGQLDVRGAVEVHAA